MILDYFEVIWSYFGHFDLKMLNFSVKIELLSLLMVKIKELCYFHPK